MSEGIGAESAETAPAETQETQQTQQPEQSQDLSKVFERLDQLTQQNQGFQEFFSRLSEPEEEEEDPYPLSEEDDGYDEQEAQRMLDSLIEARVQEHLTPLQQQQNIRDRDFALNRLEQQYPKLVEDPETGKAVLDGAVELMRSIGNEAAIDTPAFARAVELVYKAHQADASAAQETPAGSRRDVALETGGGAAPVDREDDDAAIQDRVLKAMRTGNPLV